MFEQFSEFKHVLVTGPQRSGTTICAKMIAVDTGHKFMAEGHMSHVDSNVEELYELIRIVSETNKAVIQCPIQCRWIHLFGDDTTAIVMMRRKLDDIKASEKRVGWGDGRQRIMYKGLVTNYGSMHIALVKWAYWERHQRRLIKHPFEIHYESLCDHSLWVAPKDRDNWGPRRIDVTDKFHDEIWI